MEGRLGDSHSVPAGGDTYHTTVDSSKHSNLRIHFGDNVQYVTHNEYGTHNRAGSSKRPQDFLAEHVSHGALHNSAERGPDAPKCFPKTRVAVQQDMIGWMKHGGCRSANDEAMTTAIQQQILWLSGPAGAGKTAIMGTIADQCYREGLLAGSFFFSSYGNSPDRCSKGPFISTLVYQLIQHGSIVGLRDEVLAALDRDPFILKKTLEAQVDGLVLQPLLKVIKRSDQQTWPQLVLVDGLDECRGGSSGNPAGQAGDAPMSKDDTHREILSALVHASNSGSFPFRIIVASRPERAIENYIKGLPHGSVKTIFLDNKYSPKADVELYTRAMLTTIGREFGLSETWYNEEVPPDWPRKSHRDVPRYLAEESSGQFIYVSTVLRFVQTNYDTPQQQLKRVLNWRAADASKPFAALDAVYSGIMHTSPMPFQAAFLILASQNFRWSRGWHTHTFLQSSPGHITHILGPLASLIRVTGHTGEPEFYLYHKSLTDFIEDQERSGTSLHVEEAQLRTFILDRFYAILKGKGPHIPTGPATIEGFLAEFCDRLPAWFPLARRYQYAVEDADWWLANICIAVALVPQVYHLVHQNCHWHTCRPTCKVWRKRILPWAQAQGWHVPSKWKRLRDRIKPFHIDKEGRAEDGIRYILYPALRK